MHTAVHRPSPHAGRPVHGMREEAAYDCHSALTTINHLEQPLPWVRAQPRVTPCQAADIVGRQPGGGSSGCVRQIRCQQSLRAEAQRTKRSHRVGDVTCGRSSQRSAFRKVVDGRLEFAADAAIAGCDVHGSCTAPGATCAGSALRPWPELMQGGCLQSHRSSEPLILRVSRA